VVELACLENKCAGNRTEGSNPSPSARKRGGHGKAMAVSLFEEKDSNPGSFAQRKRSFYPSPSAKVVILANLNRISNK
jgi:hypothetical protein